MTHYVITLALFCDKLCHNTSVIYVFIDNFFKKRFTASLRLKFLFKLAYYKLLFSSAISIGKPRSCANMRATSPIFSPLLCLRYDHWWVLR